MIIRITEACAMACSHCFISSTPKKPHMNFETFMGSVAFAKKAGVRGLILSGGEPTDHPQFCDMLGYLEHNYSGIVSVTTHGDYIDDAEACDRYFGKNPNVFFQVTNDARYYPKKLSRTRAAEIEKQYPNVVFVWEIGGHLYPQGRARKHMKITELNTGCVGTRCFNLRSFIRNEAIGSFKKAIAELESRMKFCTPSININGSIAMGESNDCPETAYITDTLDQVTQAMQSSGCNECGMLTALSPAHKIAVNYIE